MGEDHLFEFLGALMVYFLSEDRGWVLKPCQRVCGFKNEIIFSACDPPSIT